MPAVDTAVIIVILLFIGKTVALTNAGCLATVVQLAKEYMNSFVKLLLTAQVQQFRMS